MGSPNFFKKHAMGGGGFTAQARAIGAGPSLGGKPGGAANKDIAAAQGVYKGGLKPTAKDAASGAPGPKKV